MAKGNDPHGRIVHNYSHQFYGTSLNDAISIVRSPIFHLKTGSLALTSNIKVDWENGYRQVPVHPSNWYTQVYSLGPSEFYIDLAKPVGKANSSKHFGARIDL